MVQLMISSNVLAYKDFLYDLGQFFISFIKESSMFYLIIILFLTVYYFWSISRKSVTAEDSAHQTSEETEEKETEKDQLVDTDATYLSEDTESFESLSYEVELGF